MSLTRDTSLLRSDLARIIQGTERLGFGVRLTFIGEVAKVHPTSLSAILSGRRARVTLRTHGDLLEALHLIETGRVEVPVRARRRLGLVAQRPTGSDHCAAGHDLTDPANVYFKDAARTVRYCAPCHRKLHKEYRVRKAREPD